LKFATIVEKIKRYKTKALRELSERELGVGGSYNLLVVFDKEILLEVCDRTIRDIKSLERGEQYLPRWTELRNFLEAEITEGGREMGTLHEVRKSAPASSYTKNTVEITRDAVIITIPVFNLNATDKMELEMKPELFFFAKDYIPFILIAFHSLCFRVPLLEKGCLDEVGVVRVCILDVKEQKVLAETTHDLPHDYSVKLCNILDHSPHKSKEERAKRASGLSDLIPDYDMLVLGKKIGV
jgi:hypothetical protein